MARLTLQLLGGFSGRVGTGQPVSLGTKKAQALIAYLAVPPGRAHSRDKLASLLWGDTGDEQARQSLRQTLVAVRRALPASRPPILIVDRDSLALAPAAIEVDVQAFERLAAGGSAKALDQAMAHYQGDLLEGFRVNEEPFEDWLRAERARLRQLAVETLTRLLTHQSRAGETERAVHTAARLLALDPVQEGVHRTLMRLYARQGRRGEALRQYQVCVGVLQRELRAEPETETKHLYRELLRETAAPLGALHEAAQRQGPRTPARRPVAEDETRRLYHDILRQDARPAGISGRARVGADASDPVRFTPPVDLPVAGAPLFGREAELGQLRRLLDEAMQGSGRVATLVGEAGIGKTRLLTALRIEAVERGCRVLIGHCHESDSILPFGPWVDACRRVGLTADQEVLAQLAPAWRAELGRLFPEVNPGGLPRPGHGDLRLFEAVAQLVEHAGTGQPTVLMLEDLHWADEISLRLLAFVSRRIGAWPTLVVVTARVEDLADAALARRTLQEIARAPGAIRLALSPLSAADTRQLVRALVGDSSEGLSIGPMEEQICATSEGNPFVVVETTRAILEGTCPSDGRGSPLPAPVRELTARRLEHLSMDARGLSEVAAVIGREFDFGLLHRAGGRDEHATAEALEELVRRHVLLDLGERFRFTHERIRAVVYEGLLGPQRKVRHHRVAEALEALHGGGVDDHNLALGTHFRHAESWDKAVRYLRRAGAGAQARSAYREAVAAYDQAIEALARLPLSRETAAESIDIRLDLCLALNALAEWERARDAMHLAQAAAEMFEDTRRMGQVLDRMCLYLRLLGDHRSAIEAGRRALAMAEAIADPALTMRARFRLGHAFYATGYLEQAMDFLRQVVGTPAEDSDRKFLIGLARTWLAMVLAGLGQFDEAICEAHRALRVAEARDDPMTVVEALGGLAVVGAARGTGQPAIEAAERGLAVARAWDIVDWTYALSGALSVAHRLAGRVDEAIRHGANAVESAPPGHRARYLGWLGAAYLAAGRSSDARPAAVRALDLSREQGERRSEAEALQLLGDIELCAATPDFTAARINLEMALRLASELGLRPSVAHCHASLAKLYRQSGAHDQALSHYDTAIALYRTMDMSFELDACAGSGITREE